MAGKMDNLKIQCPNHQSGCTWQGKVKTLNSEIKDHLAKDCLYVVVSCPYKTIGSGCDFQGKRCDLKCHLNENPGEHLLLSCSAIEEMQDFIWAESRKSTTGENRKTSFDWIIEDFKAKQQEEIQGEVNYQVSDIFYSNPCQTGYALQLQVYLRGIPSKKGTHLSFFIRLTKGKNDDKLKWPFVANESFVITFQLLHSETKKIMKSREISDFGSSPLEVRKRPSRSNNGWGCALFTELSDLSKAGAPSTDRLHLRCFVPW